MRPRQVRLVILEVMAIVFGTLATFMPMKAILILASGSVPGVFPAILAEAGPFPTAILLLGASVAFGLMARFCRVLAMRGRVSEAVEAHDAASLVPRDVQRVSRARNARDGLATEVVIVLLFGVLLAWVSLPFLVLTILWLAFAILMVRASVRREGAESGGMVGAPGFCSRYLRLIRKSILASSIVISLLVLLTTDPRLGVTGALLSIVVGRRFQLAGGEVLARWLSDSTAVDEEGAQGQRPGGGQGSGMPSAVLPRLALVRDGDALDEYLRSRGRRLEECGLIGSGGVGQQGVTLVPNDGDGAATTYWRVFTLKAWHHRALEQAFRTNDAPVSLFPGESVVSVDIGALALLEVTCTTPFWVRRPVTSENLRDWQRSVVSTCFASPAFQRWADGRDEGFPEEELLSLLSLAISVPGLHRVDLEATRTVISGVNELLRQRPLCWMSQGASRTSGLLLGVDGRVVVISPQGWGVGRVGDFAGALASPEVDEDSPTPSPVEAGLPNLALMARHRVELLRELRRSNYLAAAESADRLRGLFSGVG